MERSYKHCATFNHFCLAKPNKSVVVSTCKCTARKVKEYFRKNTQKEYENLIFLLGDGLFCQ